MPVCFHHGMPLTDAGGGAPVEIDGFEEAGGGAGVGEWGRISGGAAVEPRLRFRRDERSAFCQDKPVPGSDSVK